MYREGVYKTEKGSEGEKERENKIQIDRVRQRERRERYVGKIK